MWQLLVNLLIFLCCIWVYSLCTRGSICDDWRSNTFNFSFWAFVTFWGWFSWLSSYSLCGWIMYGVVTFVFYLLNLMAGELIHMYLTGKSCTTIWEEYLLRGEHIWCDIASSTQHYRCCGGKYIFAKVLFVQSCLFHHVGAI